MLLLIMELMTPGDLRVSMVTLTPPAGKTPGLYFGILAVVPFSLGFV